jgi:hypothetical protein
MKTLLELLDLYRLAMVEKFVKRIHKHPGGQSVTDESFDWRNMDLSEIEHHLVSEFVELFPKYRDRFPELDQAQITVDDPAEESVDLGALSFVYWAVLWKRTQ